MAPKGNAPVGASPTPSRVAGAPALRTSQSAAARVNAAPYQLVGQLNQSMASTSSSSPEAYRAIQPAVVARSLATVSNAPPGDAQLQFRTLPQFNPGDRGHGPDLHQHVHYQQVNNDPRLVEATLRSQAEAHQARAETFAVRLESQGALRHMQGQCEQLIDQDRANVRQEAVVWASQEGSALQARAQNVEMAANAQSSLTLAIARDEVTDLESFAERKHAETIEAVQAQHATQLSSAEQEIVRLRRELEEKQIELDHQRASPPPLAATPPTRP